MKKLFCFFGLVALCVLTRAQDSAMIATKPAATAEVEVQVQSSDGLNRVIGFFGPDKARIVCPDQKIKQITIKYRQDTQVRVKKIKVKNGVVTIKTES